MRAGCPKLAPPNGAAQKPEVPKLILDFVRTVRLPVQPRFVARDCFKEDGSDTARVKTWFLGDNFKDHFLGKVEEPVGETNLAVSRLTRNALDRKIRSELGGSHEEVALSQFWALLQAQGRGERGPLLTNGYAIIAYIRDENGPHGLLWAVNASWYDGRGWGVDAYSVEDPGNWRAGHQVLSRN
ncbi:hypothetical protein EPN83_03390 [Patescibacteria group bacterium]|nr:MAG: hypothetical protein EPN83_03390 [Patescibacteria group bacterium]